GGATRAVALALHGGRVSGVLLLAWTGDSALSEDDITCFSAVADQLSLALVGARERATGASAGEKPSPEEQFLSFVGHGLRTPLTPMAMLLQSLERKARAGLTDLESIARARRQAARLGKLIGDVLDLSRLNSGRLALDVAPVDVAELVADVVGSFRATAH